MDREVIMADVGIGVEGVVGTEAIAVGEGGEGGGGDEWVWQVLVVTRN